MHRKILLLIPLLFAWIPGLLHAQATQDTCPPTTMEGNDFWCMFLENIEDTTIPAMSIIAAGLYDDTVHIESPHQNWDTTVTFAAGQSVTVKLPRRLCVATPNTAFTPRPFAFHITATAPCLVYASNYDIRTFDITAVLPTASLDTTYYIQNYPSYYDKEQAGFLAPYDNTHITFTPQYALGTTFPPNMEHSITLHSGRTYLLSAAYTYPSEPAMLGMKVTADKPIALFQGNTCARIKGSTCDHLVEQSIPQRYWGYDFIVVPTAGRGWDVNNYNHVLNQGDILQITSSDDSCRLYRDGIYLTTLQRGGTWEDTLPPTFPVRYNTTKPSAITLYLPSAAFSGYPGDPASVVISPIEQGVFHSIFHAVSTSLTVEQYVNIVAHTNQLAGMMLDYQYIDTFFHPFDSVYSWAQIHITEGLHRLENHSPFIAHFYGLGDKESYAYTAGMNLQPLTIVHDTILQNEVPHTFGEFTFEAATEHFRIYLTDINGCDSVVDYSLYIRKNSRYHIDTTICANQLPLQWQHLSITDTGTYYATLADRFGADSTLSLTLHTLPAYYTDTTLHTCQGHPFTWENLTFPAMDTTLTLAHTTITGCDSNTTLHLQVHPKKDTLIHLTTCTLPFEFRDTLLATAGTHTLYRSSTYGCDSNTHLTLTVYPVPQAHISAQPLHPDADHPQVVLRDQSIHATSRQWLVDEAPVSTSTTHTLLYPLKQDSVVVSLVARNQIGCADTAHLTITPNNAQVWLPNTFTPEMATNTRFCLYSHQIHSATIAIYNRHGQLITQYNPLETCWDGTDAHGTPLPQDTYVYIMEYTITSRPQNTLVHTGTVTLLR